MRRGETRKRIKKSQGFTLFEVVIVMCLIVFLYMTAEQRINEGVPAAAERAAFLGVTAQLKSGLNLQMLASVAGGRFDVLRALEGSNPMDLMLETPSNYRGAMPSVDPASLPRASWYFDQSRGELVYLVGEQSVPDVLVNTGGGPVNLGQIRLRIVGSYGRGAQSAGSQGNWEGLLLQPVFPYEWESRATLPGEI